MDWSVRALQRGASVSGAPEDDARLLRARTRAGAIQERQLLLTAAAGILPAILALNTDQETAMAECSPHLPSPSNALFESIVKQVRVVWELNQRLGWGFTADDFASLPVPTAWPTVQLHNLAAVTLVPYLDTVQTTFDGLWRAVEARHANTWRWDRLKSAQALAKLLDGIIHPGRCLRWETIDLGANWDQQNGIRPRDVRNAQSPHASILAAAAIHRWWVEAMDGESVPFVWLPGYQCFYEGRWSAVPWLIFFQSERRVRLSDDNGDFHDRNFAVPGPVGE